MGNAKQPQTETRKCDGRIRGRRQKAEGISGDLMRQEGRGQEGLVTDNQSEDYSKVLHVKAKIQSGDECVERKRL